MPLGVQFWALTNEHSYVDTTPTKILASSPNSPKSPTPSVVSSFPRRQILEATGLFPIFTTLLFLPCRINGNMQFFSDWLILLSTTNLVTSSCCESSSLKVPLYCWVVAHCMNLPELGLLLPYWMHSVLFIMLSPTNKNVISICIETFMSTQVFISFSKITREGISWYILGYV